jgi:dihydroflavonol-4-reductase
MKILVTGSTGFIGGHLCRALIALGHDVRAFHRATSTTRMLDGLPVEHAIGDLTQANTIAQAMQNVEIVFHTAALLGGSEKAGRMYAVTVEGIRSVLQAAQDAGVRRFIHTSSVAALGVPEMGLKLALPLDEKHSWNFRADYWPYGYTKYLAELEVQKAVAQGLDAVIVNPTIVIGPGDIYRQTSSIIVQVARRRIPALTEGGMNIVHIQDVVAGHLAALERGRRGERYILGGENLTHVQFIQKIMDVIGGAPSGIPTLVLPAGVARRLAFPLRLAESFMEMPISYRTLYLAGYHFYYDTARAQIELGLEPALAATQAISDAYDWFVQVGAVGKKDDKKMTRSDQANSS